MPEQSEKAPPSARRAPAQQRSRERLERILAAASALIADKGSDLMKMSEIADRAEISIASLYQYFPDKAAVIRALAERLNVDSRACIAGGLSGVHDQASLDAAFGQLMDEYYALFLEEPVTRDIRSAMQADPQLMALELAESRTCGAMLAETILRVAPRANADRVHRSSFLIWQLGEATMRLAISCPRAEGDALVEAFKAMTLREIRSLLS